MKDAYSLIKNFIIENERTSVTAEEMCKRFDLGMGAVRKVYMQLNREGILSHKKNSSRWYHDDEWIPSHYNVDIQKLLENVKPHMDEETRSLYLAAALLSGKESACIKKIKYKSYEAALEAAQSINQRASKPGFHELVPYQCPFCKLWHIGKMMGKGELEDHTKRG